MNILILNDVFAHSTENKLTYHQWLHELIKGAIEIGNPQAKVAQIHELTSVNFELFSGSGYDVLTGDRLDRAKEHLREIIHNYDLIICIEATKALRAFFEEVDCEHILIYFSPVRFSKDIYFSLQFSSPNTREKMAAYAVQESDLFDLANYWKCLINEKEEPLDMPKNSALLIGQVPKDLSVWNGSKMLTLSDYEADIRDINEAYSSILFKPHPYDRSGNASFLNRVVGEVSITDTNVYRLLASDAIAKVFAISSSVVEESRFFRKQSAYLFEPFFNADRTHLTFGCSVLSSSFWQVVLKDNKTEISDFLNDKIDMRGFRNMYWSYPYLDALHALPSRNLPPELVATIQAHKG